MDILEGTKLIDIGYNPKILSLFNNTIEVFQVASWGGGYCYYLPELTGWFAKLCFNKRAQYYVKWLKV